jgi:hypothetical protein
VCCVHEVNTNIDIGRIVLAALLVCMLIMMLLNLYTLAHN